MTRLINIIGQVYDGRDQERDWEATIGIMLHRCGVNMIDGHVLGYDGLSVAKAFTGQVPEWEAVARATGGQNAYSVLIGGDCGPPEHDGKVWQALPLDEIGWHGRQHSRGYIGIGWIADPRVQPLSLKAWDVCVDLCVAICRARGWDPYKVIKGHGEVAEAHDGSKSPGEPNACPGLTKVQLNTFRDDVAIIGQQEGLQLLHEQWGLVFST